MAINHGKYAIYEVKLICLIVDFKTCTQFIPDFERKTKDLGADSFYFLSIVKS